METKNQAQIDPTVEVAAEPPANEEVVTPSSDDAPPAVECQLPAANGDAALPANGDAAPPADSSKENESTNEAPTTPEKPPQEEAENPAESAAYDSASRKGDAVFDLTVVNKDGSEVPTPVAKKPAPVAATATATTPDDAKPKSKQTRLYFGRDRLLFVCLANAYIKHEIHKYDCPERWELAINEFYEGRGDVIERKPMISVKRPFLSGLESRIKALPKRAGRDENEEQKLCRQIKQLREDAQKQRIANGQEEPESKKRKRANGGADNRGRPRIQDIEMDAAMEQRYHSAQKVRDAEQQAKDKVTDIQRQIEEAQKRLEEAKEQEKEAAALAEEATAEFSADVINGTGSWIDMFNKLQAYGLMNGSVNIIRGQTPEMKALRRWVLRQRERYHMKEDQKSKLPWYCARNLESIGFLWRYSDGTWMKFYNELVDYKKEHGDCAVPRGYKPNPKLSQWVKRMRHEGNRFRENPNSVSMTANQLKMLEDIGFIWENLSRSWNERFEDLKKFKAEHGHCRVPKVYPANPKLVSWCQNQRAHHRAFMLGKKTFMDAARKAQLEEVGFEWETGATPGRPPSSPDKNKRARKKKEEKEDSESEEEAEEETAHMEAEPEILQQFATPQVYQNHAFAYPNHAYANPYQQQQQQQQRHFYPTL